MFPLHSDFIKQWFGDNPRYLGIPKQSLVTAPEEVLIHIDQKSYPVYLSVNPYKEKSIILCLEKLYFDFDVAKDEDTAPAFEECLSFKDKIASKRGIESLMVKSGYKGYNLYVWLKEPFYGTQEEMKEKYADLQQYLINGSTYKTLDPHVMGDFRRISRVPFSHHQVTGALVTPIKDDGEPFIPSPEFIPALKKMGLSPSVHIFKTKLPNRLLPQNNTSMVKTAELRPCMEAILNAKSVHDPHHKLKVSLVAELYEKGKTEREIVDLFRHMSGFTESVTRFQVHDIRARNMKPFECKTIQALGGCLGCSCRFYKGLE